MADDVKALIRDLREVPKDVRKGVRIEIREKGSEVLRLAKANAAWSRRIPRATRLSVKFGKSGPGVAITTSGARAPHAIHYENRGRPGAFRHPLFGNRERWYSQPARPYLGPAMDVEGPRAVRGIARVIDRALFANRFR
jgi:hypothetical protein